GRLARGRVGRCRGGVRGTRADRQILRARPAVGAAAGDGRPAALVRAADRNGLVRAEDGDHGVTGASAGAAVEAVAIGVDDLGGTAGRGRAGAVASGRAGAARLDLDPGRGNEAVLASAGDRGPAVRGRAAGRHGVAVAEDGDDRIVRARAGAAVEAVAGARHDDGHVGVLDLAVASAAGPEVGHIGVALDAAAVNAEV